MRMTAEDRRADVLRVAVHEFAKRGYQGTSTEDVARAAGISQPYLFKMFPTKKALFLALIEHGFGRVREAFVEAVGNATGDEALERMSACYSELMRDRDELLLQMQAYAACSDEDVRRKVKLRWERLMKVTGEISGASGDALTGFFARGMLMNVLASIRLVPEKSADKWGHEMLGYG